MTDPDHMTLNQAAKLLGVPRSLVVKAVAAGLLRAQASPFKSNLRPDGTAVQTLVDADDVRAAARGDINLKALEEVRTVGKVPRPSTDAETREMISEIKQTVEQNAVMTATILEILNGLPAAKPAKPSKTNKDGSLYEPQSH